MLSKLVLKEINAAFRCNIQCSFCSKTLTDPVSTLCDHQFCRKCILDFMKKTAQNTCPRCDATVAIEHLTTDKCFPELSSLVNILAKEIDAEINSSVVSATKRFDYVSRKKMSPQITNNAAVTTRVEDEIDLPRKTEARNSNTRLSILPSRGLRNGLSCKIPDSDTSIRRSNGGGTLLTQLDREDSFKSTPRLSSMETRTGFNNKLYNYIVSEDLTGQNDVDERFVGTVTPDNDSVSSPTEENNTVFRPTGTDMSVSTKVHTWLRNQKNMTDEKGDEITIDEKDSLPEAELKSTSLPGQPQTAKRQCGTVAPHVQNVATTDDAGDPYEFVPSQHAVPLKRSRSRQRAKAIRQPFKNGKLRVGKANVGRKIVPIEKAEAYTDVQLVESSHSENEDDLYRLFITPSLAVDELSVQKRKRKTRPAAPSKRKSVKDIRVYEKEISALAREIEDVEKHDLTVTTNKRRKINVEIDDDGAGPSRKSDQVGMVKQNECYFSPESSGNDIPSGAFGVSPIDDSPNQLRNEDAPVMEKNISAFKDDVNCAFTTHEENNKDEIGAETYTTNQTVNNVMVVNDYTSRLASHDEDQRKNSFDGVRGPEESRNIFHSLNLSVGRKMTPNQTNALKSVYEIDNTTTPTKVTVPNRIKSRISSFNKINSEINTPNKMISTNNTPNEMNSTNNTPNKMNSTNNTPNKMNSTNNTPNKMNSTNNTPNKMNSTINTPNKMNSTNNTPNKMNSTNNTPNKMNSTNNTPNKMTPVRTAMDICNSSTEQSNRGLENTSVCRNCGIATVSVVSLGVQTDFQFSPGTDVVMYPSFRVPANGTKSNSGEEKLNSNETAGNSDLESDRLVIDEDQRGSAQLVTCGVASLVDGSFQTPPREILNFDNYEEIKEENIEMEDETSELDINLIENRSLSRTNDSIASQTQALNAEQLYGNQSFSRTKRKGSVEPENLDGDADTSPEIKFQVENECYMNEDMFTPVGDRRNKFRFGQTSTPKSDSDDSVINRPNRKGNTSRRLEDSFDEEDPKNIFEAFSNKRWSCPKLPEPTGDANDNSFLKRSPPRSAQKTRTRRGLANIQNLSEEFPTRKEHLTPPTLVEFGINDRPFIQCGGGSPQGDAKSKTMRNLGECIADQGDSSSEDVILPTPDSKTRVGRSFTSVTELNEDEAGGKQKKVDDSGYGSTKKNFSAKKSLSNLFDDEKVKREIGDESAFVDEENVKECSIVSRESEVEKLRRKHKSFLECPEESHSGECESEKNVQCTPIGKKGTQTERRATPKSAGIEVTDSELLNLDMDLYDDGDQEIEKGETTTNYSPRKANNESEKQIIDELSISRANSKPSASVQVVPEASTSGIRRYSGLERMSSNIRLQDRSAARRKEVNKNNSRQGENVIEEPVEEERRLSFVASGLAATEMKQVQDLANKINGDFRLKFSDDTSHVIVKTGRDFITNRTLKYLEGIAFQRWIVSFDWVTDSLRSGQLQNEERYEVVGDRSQGNHSGPMRSRLSNELLLKNYEICCFGDFLELSKDDIIRLASACGASSVFSATMFSYEPGMIQLLLLQAIRPVNQIQDVCNKYGVIAVARDWLLDSISHYRILPMNTYPHLNPSV